MAQQDLHPGLPDFKARIFPLPRASLPAAGQLSNYSLSLTLQQQPTALMDSVNADDTPRGLGGRNKHRQGCAHPQMEAISEPPCRGRRYRVTISSQQSERASWVGIGTTEYRLSCGCLPLTYSSGKCVPSVSPATFHMSQQHRGLVAVLLNSFRQGAFPSSQGVPWGRLV